MVILISPEKDLPQEHEILHQLFKAGLQYYHLRKPDYDEEQYRNYLDQIDPSFLQNLMLHNHHGLADSYPIKGIHLEEANWRGKGDQLAAYATYFQTKGKMVSSSYHEIEDLEQQKAPFDYYMLSPVFGAISKPGYQGRGFDVSQSNKKIVGMGGINAQTTPKALQLGFKGVGTLGGIWNAKNPVQAFKEIHEVFTKNSTP